MGVFSDGLSWLKAQFIPGEDDPELESWQEESDSEARALPARAMRPLETVIMTPSSYGDARRAVEVLEQGLVVIVVFTGFLSEEVAGRFVDFMSGASYMAHGSVELLNTEVLICTPERVRIQKDMLVYSPGMPVWRGKSI
ncbi:MAG: cell division protein SepF [Dialister sp.]|nr:cell division protein SepF [Dialister sp.]